MRTSPWPGFMRRNRTRRIMSDRCRRMRGSWLRVLTWVLAAAGRRVGYPRPSRYVDRARARADLPQSAGDGPGCHLLGRPGRRQRVIAPGQASGQHAEWVQPEPCAAPSGWRSPRRCRRVGAAVEEQVDGLLAVASGDDDDGAGRVRGLPGPAARAACSGRGAGPSPSPPPGGARATIARASGRFGVTTVARGKQAVDQRAPRSGLQQVGTGLGHHHRVDDHGHRREPSVVERRRRRPRSSPRSPSIPIFTASMPMSSLDGPDLSEDHLRRHVVDGGDADGVLRGDRGDRGHPVDTAGGERLQVGLDAGAAAGVRAGDREDARDAPAWALEVRLGDRRASREVSTRG